MFSICNKQIGCFKPVKNTDVSASHVNEKPQTQIILPCFSISCSRSSVKKINKIHAPYRNCYILPFSLCSKLRKSSNLNSKRALIKIKNKVQVEL